jgi:voltage-gated potassium channel
VTLALIPVFVIEAEAKSSRWKDIAYAANWLVWLVFAAELAFILFVAPRKAAALRAHWLDAVIVVTTAPAFSAFLSSLRLLRLARLLRFLRLGALLTRLAQRARAVTSGTHSASPRCSHCSWWWSPELPSRWLRARTSPRPGTASRGQS